MHLLKVTALAVLDRPAIGSLLGWLRPGRCAILMLHRFATPDGTHVGHDPKQLRALLSYLRKSGIDVVDVDHAHATFFEREGQPKPGRPSVAFTVDDGYADLIEVAGPIFSEFDCPATGYVVPDVVDGRRFFWWDQIDWAFRQAAVDSLTIELDGALLRLTWPDDAGRRASVALVGDALKRLPDSERLAFIDELSARVDVPLLSTPRPEYRVVTWDEMRAAEQRGMRFGAHSMTHPILSRCSDAQSAHEILASVGRVRAELANPSQLFCYPNGTDGDFGQREIATVRAAGMRGALSTTHALLGRGHGPQGEWRWKAPRFAYDERPGATARLLLV